MLKFYKILFFNSLIAGTLIAVSAYSWFNMWIGLEINLLSIIPLMKAHNNVYPAEAAIKYFITQSLASTLILFAILMSLNFSEFITNELNYWFMLIMASALLTKLGAAPFHAWFPEVMEGLNWMNSLILLTWQKLAPMILVMYNLEMKNFFTIVIIISSIIGGILGFNQISLRKLMAYSSITHISWMLASMLSMKMIWLNYFIIYSIISLNIILIFHFFKIFYLNQLLSIMNTDKLIKLFFTMNFLSLGGLPPFMGFMPKWLVINGLVNSKFYMMSTILIIFTLITLYFYLRMTFSTLTITMSENLLKKNKMNYLSLIIINTLTLTGLFMCTIIFNIF
uniref:NADH dehydrogenase subunit 2 n=1 Tax=Agetocera filicornis TaxID=1391560 RepID=UPI00286BA563|nr:NADH dehydrogenase subunit 2 [Agetocera filicornis]WKW54881.1 NADH dehydrogenase subunit 2 [Agetocera filicornis]